MEKYDIKIKNIILKFEFNKIDFCKINFFWIYQNFKIEKMKN